MRARVRILAATALLAAAAFAGAACSGLRSAARVHPESLTEAPRCGTCHEKGAVPDLDHVRDWSRTHGTPARQNNRTCELCHLPSFCGDCHGRKEEIKPSDKGVTRPGAAAPHRGNYIVQHRVDGRLDPASCFSCHGRKNEWRCAQCHR